MNDTLRMDHDGHLLRRQVEQPARFDDLQPLVHQRGRVDRDLVAHLPRRMLQGIGDPDTGEVVGRPVQKRPARRGQDDPLDVCAPVTVQGLEHRVVFAIDRQKPHSAAGSLARHQFARHDQRFLVGERHILARANRGQRRGQAQRPDQCRHDQVRGCVRRDVLQTLRTPYDGTAVIRDCAAQCRDVVFPCHGNETGPERADLLAEARQVLPRGQRGHLEPVGEPRDDVERRDADRTRRAENGEPFHVCRPSPRLPSFNVGDIPRPCMAGIRTQRGPSSSSTQRNMVHPGNVSLRPAPNADDDDHVLSPLPSHS